MGRTEYWTGGWEAFQSRHLFETVRDVSGTYSHPTLRCPALPARNPGHVAGRGAICKQGTEEKQSQAGSVLRRPQAC